MKTNDGHRYRIVLADDQPEVRGALRRFLDRDGRFDVVAEVGDGAAAVSAVTSERPDCAVLDLAMPTLDGLEALRQVMAIAPQTRVVILSSMVPFSNIGAEALAAGAIAAFDKFTSPKKVIKALIASLTQPSQPARTL